MSDAGTSAALAMGTGSIVGFLASGMLGADSAVAAGGLAEHWLKMAETVDDKVDDQTR